MSIKLMNLPSNYSEEDKKIFLNLVSGIRQELDGQGGHYPYSDLRTSLLYNSLIFLRNLFGYNRNLIKYLSFSKQKGEFGIYFTWHINSGKNEVASILVTDHGVSLKLDNVKKCLPVTETYELYEYLYKKFVENKMIEGVISDIHIPFYCKKEKVNE